MNVKHIWSVLCRESLIDGETNNISLMNVFERLEVALSQTASPDVPLKVPLSYELISLWTKKNLKKKAQVDQRIDLTDPEGNVIKDFSKSFEIPKNKKRLRSRLKISGLEVKKSGIYLFKLSVRRNKSAKYKLVAEIPLEVEIKRETAQKARNA